MTVPRPAHDRPDGRQLRAARTRETVARAMLALLDRGNLSPTAREVAAQAGVSERAVFRHFEDLESLLHAVSDIHAARVAAHAPAPAPADAPRAERLDRFVERWSAVYEMIAPVRRAAQLKAPFSEAVRSRHAWMRRVRTRELREAIGIARDDPAPAAQADTLAALAAVVSWSFWEQLRERQRLSKERASAVVRSALDALLLASVDPRV